MTMSRLSDGTDIWQVLGIARTADTHVIRRAYGAKLRSLNVDSNPAGFMALRAALERALELASQAVPEPDATVDDAEDFDFDDYNIPNDIILPESPPDYQPQAFADTTHNYHASGDRRRALSQILQARGVKAGWDYYNMLMARGDIALDDQTSFAMLVLEKAIDPQLLSSPDFLMIYERLGLEDSSWRFEGHAELQKQVQNRVAALQWLAKLRALASRRARGAEKYEVIAARLFLRQQQWLRSKRAVLDALTKILTAYQTHAAWLANDIDTPWLANLNARVQRAIRIKNRNEKLYVIVICVVVFGDILGVLVRSVVDYVGTH